MPVNHEKKLQRDRKYYTKNIKAKRLYARENYYRNREAKNNDSYELYHFYLKLGLCVSCHKEYATTTVLCFECNENKKKRDKERNTEEKKIIRNTLARQRRQQRRKDGICTKCGKHPAEKNTVYCYICSIKTRRRSQKEKKGIPRNARPSFGLCYFCGEPVLGHHNVCAKHYDICVSKFAETNKTPQSSCHLEQCKTHEGEQ